MPKFPGVSFKILSPLRNRDFALLWSGQTVSTVGDYALAVALPIWVYQLTGSTIALGAMAVCQTIPMLIFGLLSGALVDRYDRKRIMIIGDILRGVLLLTLMFVQSAHHILLLYFVAFLNASVSRFFVPARNAVIPNIVHKDLLPIANALSATRDTLIMLVVPALGAGLVGIAGPQVAVLIDAVSFLIAGSATVFIATPLPAIASKDKPTPRLLLHEIAAGIRYLQTNHVILALTIIGSIFKAGQAVLSMLTIVFITQVLNAPPATLGVAMSAFALGLLTSDFIIGNLRQCPTPARLITVGMTIIAICILLSTNIIYLSVFLFLSFVRGLGTAAMGIGDQTLYQTAVSNEFRGRISGTVGTLYAVITIFSTTLASGAADLIGIQNTFNVCGVIILMSSIYSYVVFRKSQLADIQSPAKNRSG
jgi:MFS family permease